MFLVTCSTMFVELLKVVLFKGYYHILSCLNAKIKQLFDIHKFVNIVVRPIFVGFTPTRVYTRACNMSPFQGLRRCVM